MDFSELVSLINARVFLTSVSEWISTISVNSVIVLIMMIFMVVGAVDKIRGNKLGYGEEFDKGFRTIGSLASCMAAIIACSTILSALLLPIITPIYGIIGADPSTFPTTLLASDMGGYAMATNIASNEAIGNFSGLIIGTIMGPTMVFTVPVALSMLEKKDHAYIGAGVLSGLVAVPVGCFIGGLLMNLTSYKISLYTIAINLIPVTIFAILIILGLWLKPKAIIKIFGKLGNGVMIFIVILTAIAAFQQVTGIMFPLLHVMSTADVNTGMTPFDEGLLLCGQIGIVLIGAFPMIKWITKRFAKPLRKLGTLLKINDESCAGLVANTANSLATFGMIKNMDNKGKLLNLAFAVSASFVFGDHLGFAAGVNEEMVFPMIIGKLSAGIIALLIANLLAPKILNKAIPKETNEQINAE